MYKTEGDLGITLCSWTDPKCRIFTYFLVHDFFCARRDELAPSCCSVMEATRPSDLGLIRIQFQKT